MVGRKKNLNYVLIYFNVIFLIQQDAAKVTDGTHSQKLDTDTLNQLKKINDDLWKEIVKI